MYNKVDFSALHYMTKRQRNSQYKKKKTRVMMIRDYQLSHLASVSLAFLNIPFLFASTLQLN
jgi:hypothetical protein